MHVGLSVDKCHCFMLHHTGATGAIMMFSIVLGTIFFTAGLELGKILMTQERVGLQAGVIVDAI